MGMNWSTYGAMIVVNGEHIGRWAAPLWSKELCHDGSLRWREHPTPIAYGMNWLDLMRSRAETSMRETLAAQLFG